jgi:predicted Zn-dependent peptidase
VTDGAAAAELRITTLDSGLRIVTERLPQLRSVAIGFWVGTGSRDETDEIAGASHFLEHLLFKGTERRNAIQIADAVESVGGDMNAFTAHELTAYYVRIPDRCLAMATEILSDIMWSPALLDEELESERHVILEEIHMRDDTPDDLVHDVFSEALFPLHPIGREIIGTPASVGGMPRDAVAQFHREHYHPSNVVVAAAGNLEHDDVVALVEAGLEAAGAGNGARPARVPYTGGEDPLELALLERPTEQAHLVLGMRGIARDDPDRYALNVLNQVLGGGMSSRLFQEIRERRGLAYSVYSYRAAYEETGALAVYAGTSPEHADQVLGLVETELDRIANDRGVSEHELASAKGNLVGSLALGLETSASRMHRVGRSLLTLGEVPSLDTVVAEIERVTPDDLARIVDRVFAREPRTLAVVGPFAESDFAPVRSPA